MSESAISVRNVTFKYGNKSIIKNLSLDVKKGECLCLLGPNGCGKTTLLNCISGGLEPQQGEILLNGKPVKSMSIVERAKTMGYVFQEHSAPFPYTAIEVVRMGRTPHLGLLEAPKDEDTSLAYKAMQELGIAHLSGECYTKISGGERQLVLIARTLCQQPDIILFDEPTSHLDFKNQAMVLRIVKKLSEKGLTIIMTSHFPNHVWHIGTKVAMLNYDGVVAVGDSTRVMTQDNLSTTYGVNVNIYEGTSGDKRTRFCDPDLD